MKKNDLKKVFIFIRYLILLLAMFSLPVIYFILTPITLYSLKFILGFFFNNIIITGNIIAVNNSFIEIIDSCIAGSAYLLLLILNLAVSMPVLKRIYSLLFSFSLFFILNLIRIIIFSLLFASDFAPFDFLHMFFWYILSTIFVVFIWLLTVKLFKINEIPVYSDIKFFIKNK